MEAAQEEIKEKKLESLQSVYTIESHDELVTFLMEILAIKDNVDSEEELQEKILIGYCIIYWKKSKCLQLL